MDPCLGCGENFRASLGLELSMLVCLLSKMCPVFLSFGLF